MARAVPCSAESFSLAAEWGCGNRESKVIQDEIASTYRVVGCPNPIDTGGTYSCFLPFRISSWFKKVVFCKSLQLKSLSQTIPAHCTTLSCVGCHWKRGTDLITWTELLLAPFDGLLPHMRIAYLSHSMTQSTNTEASQVWKHKSKSQGMALLSLLCLLHSRPGVMANDCSWKGTMRCCRLAACWVQRGAGSKCFIHPNPVGICWSSDIVLLTQEDVITAEYEGVNTLWNTVLAVMQTNIVLFEMKYQQCWLTR